MTQRTGKDDGTFPANARETALSNDSGKVTCDSGTAPELPQINGARKGPKGPGKITTNET